MQFLFSTLLCFLAIPLLATEPREVNREPLFQVAHRIVPAITEYYRGSQIIFRMQDFFDKNSRWDMELLKTGSQGLSYPQNFVDRKKAIKLVFTDEQNHFDLAPGEPTRTAATLGKEPKNPIYINNKIVRNPKNKFNLLDALQLMLHENFHYSGNTDQQQVDETIAWMVQGLLPYYQEIVFANGERLMILSWPLHGDHPLLKEAFLIDSGFVALKETKNGVEDWTQKIGGFLTKDSLIAVQGLDPGYAAITHHELTWESQTVSSNPEAKSMNISASIQRRDRLYKYRIGGGDYDNGHYGKANFGLKLKFTEDATGSNEIESISIEKNYRAIVDLPFRLTLVDSANKQWTIKATFDDELVWEIPPRLLVTAGQSAFEVSAEPSKKKTNELLFKVGNPNNSIVSKLEINTLLLEGDTQAFADQTLTIEQEQNASPAGKIELVKVEFSKGSGWVEPNESTNHPKGKGKIRFTLKSDSLLMELQLRLGYTFREITNPEMLAPFPPDKPGEDIFVEPNKHSRFSHKTEYFNLVFTAAQLVQKKDKGLIIVEVPVDHFLRDSNRSQIGTYTLTIGEKDYVSKVYYNMTDDIGKRTLQDLSFTNENFVKSVSEKVFKYSLESPYRTNLN